ncbi:TetR/AcrR family transcriptional regulator [Ferrovibrio xuzhouensis]|uniref:TetR/AcrR family transcriptional regulator n=1 Tax=Ferrovibrio xuzhouensis TaxID=1576914 RepID=A0ABV7VF16_9PROT
MARPKGFDTAAALERAMELFWQQGYATTSMEQLVAAMGISRQSLYDTYGDKHALFLAAIDSYCARLATELLAPLAKPDAGLAALHATAMGVVDFIIRYPKRRACLMANTALELAPHDAVVAAKVRSHMAAMEAAFRHAIDNAQARGEIATDGDPDALARYLVAMANGLLVMGKSGASREQLTQMAEVAAGALRPSGPQAA